MKRNAWLIGKGVNDVSARMQSRTAHHVPRLLKKFTNKPKVDLVQLHIPIR